MNYSNVDNTIVEFLLDLIEKSKDILKKKNKSATSELINSFKLIREQTNVFYKYNISVAPHSIFVDRGRKPGSKYPPKKEIDKWISVRGIKPDNGITEKQLSFLIRRKIGIRGIPPTPFLYIIENGLKDINKLLEKPLKDDINIELNRIINEFKNKIK